MCFCFFRVNAFNCCSISRTLFTILFLLFFQTALASDGFIESSREYTVRMAVGLELDIATGSEGFLFEEVVTDAFGNQYFVGVAHNFLRVGYFSLNITDVYFVLSIDWNGQLRWLTPIADKGEDVDDFQLEEGFLRLSLMSEDRYETSIWFETRAGMMYFSKPIPSEIEEEDTNQNSTGGSGSTGN